MRPDDRPHARAHGEDGDLEYQLNRAEIIEAGYTGEYWQEVAGLETELSVRDCHLVISPNTLERDELLELAGTRVRK